MNSCARGKATPVGNFFVYGVPLFVRGDRIERLASEWLPFYDDALRRERLELARWFVLDNNLARIPWFVGRDLHFQTFDRFYRAFQGFLLGAVQIGVEAGRTEAEAGGRQVGLRRAVWLLVRRYDEYQDAKTTRH